jgi:superfamily II DNA or RNA helicase
MPTGIVSSIAPGSRIIIRDAEWLVRRVDRSSTGGQALKVLGLSELVRDKEATFLDDIEKDMKIVDPIETELVSDNSPTYRASMLFMESLLRQTPPTDENLYIGHRGAMDSLPFQLDPTIQALKQTRQRMLIADAVGLGKTLEAGILLSELIRRGRGKRILVVAVKSMLTQFQKEMWSRFSIPLIRLDSLGIQRIRSRIPTNHNPFFYYDKVIISIDTLKQNTEYRTYLENAYWDIIVIDEAHNVAERGAGGSQRAKLAKLLASRSDTLLMLSATPHDGRAKSFASLMNMLDPTAIANPEDYGPDDIKGLFIRRFKKDIKEQVELSFKERKIAVARSTASPAEEEAFEFLANLKLSNIDNKKGAGQLFRTTIEKAFFSSPIACLETVQNRLKRIEKAEVNGYEKDIALLQQLAYYLECIADDDFSKYALLLDVITRSKEGFGWKGKDRCDRLVVFTERIATLQYLAQRLPSDLGLKEKHFAILHGGLPDINQQKIVEDFGNESSPIRLLIASDVASEGINLHYLSHRMIHFDIPWSLMVFQQRNGRIDRYGQEKTPEIVYLMTESVNSKIKGDNRILELLIQKDQQAVENIGDPAAFMDVYDINTEEKLTAQAIEEGKTAAEFGKEMDEKLSDSFDVLGLLLGDATPPTGQEAEARCFKMPSLYHDDYAYLEDALNFLQQSEPLQFEAYPDEKRIEFTITQDLKQRLQQTPRESWPKDDQVTLSSDIATIQDEIKRSRKDESAWPTVQYLWELNPVVGWANDKVIANFNRNQAPVLTLNGGGLVKSEVVFVMSGLIPNRKSHPLVHIWFGVSFVGGQFKGVEEFDQLASRSGLGSKSFPNRGTLVEIEPLRQLLPLAIDKAHTFMGKKQVEFEAHINPQLDEHLAALEKLRAKQYEQLELTFQNSRLTEKTIQERKAEKTRSIDRIFDEFLLWVEDTMTTEPNPYIKVISVLKAGD